MVLPFGFGLLLLVASAALVGGAGGIDLLSATDWQAISEKWRLPPEADNGRRLLLLTGLLMLLLAVVRLATSPQRSSGTARL
jgi:hypothetical protein